MMKRLSRVLLGLVLLATPIAPAFAAVNVERHGDENPMVEVARSTMYGALVGLLVGGAIELASKSSDGEALRWGIVGGTAIGLGYGLYWSAHRPKDSAMLEFDSGTLHARVVPPIEMGASPGGPLEARVRVIGVSF